MNNDFSEKLIEWHKDNNCNFSWRKKKLSDFEIVMTAFLLLQEPPIIVNQIWNSFFKLYNNYEKITNSSLKEIHSAISPLGVLKAELLQKVAQSIEKNTDLSGLKLEKHLIDWILLQKKNQNIIIDPNIKRIIERIFGEFIEEKLFLFYDGNDAKQIYEAFYDFGIIVCSYYPACRICPFNNICKNKEIKNDIIVPKK